MRVHRLLTLGPSEEALWVKVYVRQLGERWVAMILRDDDPPPGREELRGIAFFGDTPEEAEQEALEYLGMDVEQN
jgi:hypothetical protein